MCTTLPFNEEDSESIFVSQYCTHDIYPLYVVPPPVGLGKCRFQFMFCTRNSYTYICLILFTNIYSQTLMNSPRDSLPLSFLLFVAMDLFQAVSRSWIYGQTVFLEYFFHII